VLARSVLRRKHDLATFVHEQLEWSLVNQSPEQLETEWLRVDDIDIAGYKIINISLLVIPINTQPHVHTSQWRLQLTTCQLGLQQNI